MGLRRTTGSITESKRSKFPLGIGSKPSQKRSVRAATTATNPTSKPNQFRSPLSLRAVAQKTKKHKIKKIPVTLGVNVNTPTRLMKEKTIP